MSITPMETAVVLFVFNRPELTEAAMKRLAPIRPRNLWVISDGPRDVSDADLCRRTLDAVNTLLPPTTELHLLISDENLGCRRRIESGLDWVFAHTDRAIILEDDIEVIPQFFEYAEHALKICQDRPSIRMISGRNALIESPSHATPFLARKGSIWAWATWASRWQAYRTGFSAITRSELIKGLERENLHPLFFALQQHLAISRLWEKIDTWDMQWSLWNIATGGFSVIPSKNFSANHGLGPGATHTTIENDVRGAYPLDDRTSDQRQFSVQDLTIDQTYDLAYTLLELMLNYHEPRRWKLLARRREVLRQNQNIGWDLMLAPFDYRCESRTLISHLRTLISHPQLDALADVFEGA